MINIHPSLLPPYKGLHTHERALADGAKEHGCTVHLVTAELDAGPVIVQAEVPVMPGDTPETLRHGCWRKNTGSIRRRWPCWRGKPVQHDNFLS